MDGAALLRIGYGSAYLEHLARLSQEAAQRLAGIPPFPVMIAVAIILHGAMMVPMYLFNPAAKPRVTQVELAFGRPGAPGKGQGGKAASQAATESGDVEEGSIVAQMDRMFQPPPAPAPVRPTLSQPVQPVPDMPVITPSDLERLQPDRMEMQALRNDRNGARSRSQGRHIVGRPGRYGASHRTIAQGIHAEGTFPGEGGEGGEGGENAAAVRDAVLKYEQLLSAWIEKHKLYPQEAVRQGLEGEVVLRLRITRRGAVVFKAIETSSKHRTLDQAVLETVSRATPMPVVPEEYPGGAQLEFLVPISFSLE